MHWTARGLSVALLLVFSVEVHGQPYGLNQRPAIGPFLNGAMPESAPTVSGNWAAVVAFPNLIFTNALGLAPVPGTDRLIVWEREGRAWSFVNSSNATQPTLVLDISNQCQGWDDSGLLGLAFHPAFVTNRLVFVYYTWVVPGTVQGDPNSRPPHTVAGNYHDRLSRFTLDAAGVAVAGSERVLVDQTGNDTWHNGGGLFFHPDNGFLYWTDGGDANGANNQVIHVNLFAGVFRIDVDMRGGAISHPIPRQMSSEGGHIYKLARTGPPPASRPFPLFLSQTGAFTNLAALAPAPGLVPYNVNSPLWSDGAVKTR